MRALENWCKQNVFTRRFKVWTHYRRDDGSPGDEIWWHVELSEHLLEHRDHGQRRRSMAWTTADTTYVGYGPTLAEAARNALRRAKQGPPKEYGA